MSRTLVLAVSVFLGWPVVLWSQTGVGIGTPAPAPSAMLDIVATDKGVLVPRLTTSQRLGISSPAAGLWVYDADTKSFWYFDGAVWRNMGAVGVTYPNRLQDADMDTRIMVEKNSNEDIIRMDVGGTEIFTLWKNVAGYTMLEPKGASSNTFFGANAGKKHLSGDYNTFIGAGAGIQDSTGFSNTYIGVGAGALGKAGAGNIAVGVNAGAHNNGSSNTFLGTSTGGEHVSGNENTYVGTGAGTHDLTGYSNLFGGSGSGIQNTSGSRNTYLGVGAGANNQTGAQNVCLGYNAGMAELASNRLYIENSSAGRTGALIYGEFDNDRVRINSKLGIGRDATTNALEINGNMCSKSLAGSWAANSDARLKKNVTYLDYNPEQSLHKLLQLRGVTYEWNDDKTGMERPAGIFLGFIAQDLQKVFPEKVALDNQGYLQTAYGDYDPIFVESFRALDSRDQQLKEENAGLKAEVGDLKIQLVQQQKDLEELKALVQALLEGKK